MDTFYEKEMSQLCRDYNAYIAQAQNMNRRNGYEPTMNEYQLYLKAAEVARKIANINTAQRALYKQWSERTGMCEQKAVNIYKVLNPETEKKEHPSIAKMDNADKIFPQQDQVSSSFDNVNSNVGYVVTASGFKTKNASEDVTAETIEKWYESKPSHSIDDVVGMEEIKQTIKEELLDNVGWDETDAYLKIPQLKSFLFYGPFGTGKTYFIEAVARNLMDKGFRFIHLLGSDVHDSYVGVGEKIVKTAFKEAVDNAPCVLYFDEFDLMCAERSAGSESHEKRLSGAFMEAYNIIKNSNKPIVFLAATNYPDRIEHAMLSRIMTFVLVPLPSEEIRLEYFKKSLSGIKLEDGFDYEYMADMTDNYSFRDLSKITDKIKIMIKSQSKQQFSLYDDQGNIMQKESDQNVKRALAEGETVLTKELYDNVQSILIPEKKSDILASIKAFENKK